MQMTGFGKTAISALTAAGLLLMAAGGGWEQAWGLWNESTEAGRMKNVVLLEAPSPAPREATAEDSPLREEAAVRTLALAAEPERMDPAPDALPAGEKEQVLETTIEGGMRIKNETGYYVDAAALLADGPGIRLPRDEAQILIIHTHASEAYTQAGLDRYVPSDTNRTEDTQFNIVRIGDELTALLTQAGLRVIHDRGIYDYPSYTGSYSRSGAAVERWLADYPSLRIVIDLHRDAIGSGDVVYRTRAVLDGVSCAQVMLLAGTGANGLSHPNWRENLKLALWLQRTAEASCPGLMRPLEIVPERYNQQLSPGSLILEVGSTGNSLREAVLAATYFGRAVGPGLAEYITNAAD